MDTPDPKGDTPIPTRMTLSPEDVRALNTASEMIHRGMRVVADLDGLSEKVDTTLTELNDALKALAAGGEIRGPVEDSTVTADNGLVLRVAGGYRIPLENLNNADCLRVLRAMPEWLRDFTVGAFTTFETLSALHDIAGTVLGIVRGGTVEVPRAAEKAPEASPAEGTPTPAVAGLNGATEHAPRGVQFGQVHYGPDGSSWLPVRVVRIRGEGRYAMTPAVLALRPPGLPPYDIGPFVSCSTEHIPLDVWQSCYGVAGAAAGQ